MIITSDQTQKRERVQWKLGNKKAHRMQNRM